MRTREGLPKLPGCRRYGAVEGHSIEFRRKAIPAQKTGFGGDVSADRGIVDLASTSS